MLPAACSGGTMDNTECSTDIKVPLVSWVGKDTIPEAGASTRYWRFH
ncbi:MAG: hypothetical protein IPJ82_18405 [Lewinellaceae bacterium]|nr:hypothetical protein [Lewinellaceae bacterium]